MNERTTEDAAGRDAGEVIGAVLTRSSCYDAHPTRPRVPRYP